MEHVATGKGEIWLDLTRLLWSVNRSILTGIDRVELAYAEYLLANVPQRTRFVTFDYRGSFRFLPHDLASRIVLSAGAAWQEGTIASLVAQARLALVTGVFVGRRVRQPEGHARPVYLNVSSHPLHRPVPIRRMMRDTGALFVPLLHDIIPLEHPEYVREPWVERARLRLNTVCALADGVITNSVATADSVRPLLPAELPILPLPLGVTPRPGAPPAQESGRPYFLLLSTIEPRKNHITLLHLWRRFAQTMGEGTPRLVVVGGRGWETEHVADFLDRCQAIHPHVEERGRLSDEEVASLMAGARALLMPSFTEGYGLPVAEALACGLPVICSDIPAHHEIGTDVPEYLDPIDTLAWGRAILDYASEDSPMRSAQMERMASWQCPKWDTHVAAALEFLDALAATRSPEDAYKGSKSRTCSCSHIDAFPSPA
jgi:glycosyltransferase involved in cell wall biosynthesis